MFVLDLKLGTIMNDADLKASFAASSPFGEFLAASQLHVPDVQPAVKDELLVPRSTQPLSDDPFVHAFGYTMEHCTYILGPMASDGMEGLGSMGNDMALAAMSSQPKLVYDYFKQLFAQVTNPPIDPIREEVVMSLECPIGPETNLLSTTAQNAHRLLLKQPVLTPLEMHVMKHDIVGWSPAVIDTTYPVTEGAAGLTNALSRIADEAEHLVNNDTKLLLLSDKAVGKDRVAVSALLAMGAVHHHLLKKKLRSSVGILVESGEAREVMHHCLLTGFGADAIFPYMAYEVLYKMKAGNMLPDKLDHEQICRNYQKAANKGMLKVMAKMGISTLASYKGAQIFEAVGLNDDVMNQCFSGTASRIRGVDFQVIANDYLYMHRMGFPTDGLRMGALRTPGEYHWRTGGEEHTYDPVVIANLQLAARTNAPDAFARFCKLADEQTKKTCLRGLLDFKTAETKSVAIEDVEPASDIVKRFCTGAMSLGNHASCQTFD